jgi:nucleotidyltransferase substrate binding protein (TIGR01987 family)
MGTTGKAPARLRERDTLIDIEPLERAIQRLQEGWAEHQREPARAIVRDGLIQRFEFTHEISHRMLKRFLQAISASPDAFDAMPFQDVVRCGNEAGLLLRDWPAWKTYRHMRSLTSHTYAEAVALEVVAGIPAFLEEAVHLRDALAQRLAK